MNRQEFEARIIAKAWKDEEFRKRLVSEPNAVLADELAALHAEAKLPSDVKVTVLEEKADQIYLVLPLNPHDFHDGELSEDQLLAVAGGAGGGGADQVVAVGQVNVAGPTLDVVQVVGVVAAGTTVVVI